MTIADQIEHTAFRTAILAYLRAGFAALYVTTWEEERAERNIKSAASDATLRQGRGVWIWSSTRGWVEQQPDGRAGRVDAIKDPLAALDKILTYPEECVFILRDYHHYLEHPDIIRKLRDTFPIAKSTGRTLIFESPRLVLPVELEKDIALCDFNLPKVDELAIVLDGLVASVGADKAGVTDRRALLDATRGLTVSEAENTLSLALVKHGAFNDDAIVSVQREKAGLLKKTGILEYFEPSETMDSVGGLNALKHWLTVRERTFGADAQAYGLLPPRGLLLVGVQGCGKSMVAKAIAKKWRRPLLRFDISRVFGGIVGQSERQMRTALDVSEAVGGVLWVDELEKGLAGLASSGMSDAGTAARVFGTFLTWLQEKSATAPFVVATSNDISLLPPELLRKGRFDEIFFVDLPTVQERAEIFAIHLRERKRDPNKFDLSKLSNEADEFSGAEIREVILDGMTHAFANEGQEVTTDHVLNSIRSTKPLAKTAAARVQATREWAKDRARKATEVVESPVMRRRISPIK